MSDPAQLPSTPGVRITSTSTPCLFSHLIEVKQLIKFRLLTFRKIIRQPVENPEFRLSVSLLIFQTFGTNPITGIEKFAAQIE